jgi:CDP-glycerol glycerophosphotransferase (TagB/SpsB family)
MEYSFDPESMSRFLMKHNLVLVIKPHFIELNEVLDNLKGFDRIKVYQEADPYPLLKYTDILITDYSSVIFDFLVTDKPIIFTPFDMEYYIKNINDFYFDYREISAGPQCKDWLEVQKNIVKILGDDPYTNQRRLLNSKFNKFSSHHSERLVEFLKQFL